jgi:hypothetical protein
MPQVNMYVEHAKNLLNPPTGWDGYRFKAIGGIKAKLIEVTGAVASLKTKGKCKGSRNWKQLDKSTIATAYFTPEEHDAWLKTWEQKTGKCGACAGDGKELEKWSAQDGATYRNCRKCEGSGRPDGTRLPEPEAHQ